MRTTGPSAAIAAIMPGIQAQGLWAGYRQLVVRFAAEAETATLYSPEMLARALERATAMGALHSISLAGKDPTSCASFIGQAWNARGASAAALTVMLDCNGQRPEGVAELATVVSLVQVTVTLAESPEFIARALATLSAAARAGLEHAAVVAPGESGPSGTPASPASDGSFTRFVEQMHAASPGTKLVVHPPAGAERAPLDRRYSAMLERAAAVHGDVRLVMRIPAPVGVR